jgi:predicted transcriptional regulator of viral defense system
MKHRKPASLGSYLIELLAAGRVVFTRDEAEKAVGITPGAFLDAAERLQKRGQLLSPRRGFYVLVPPQFRNLGSPPPAWFIDDLMRHEASPYYVGLLKAAELHGASHQAVMEFQVVATKRLPELPAGRSKIAFYYRKELASIAKAIEERNTDTGRMKLSSPELTFLDLLRYPQASGGIDNVATILEELGGKLDAGKLAAISGAFERSVLQRAGYLLRQAGLQEPADAVQARLEDGPVTQWIELDPSLTADPDLAPPPIERDRLWRVVVRHVPERDL